MFKKTRFTVYNMDFADHARFSSKTSEDDGNDHIDSDTPRSGVATPRPDPSDKRLPGIMHSYIQVGPDFGSSESPTLVPLETPAWGSAGQTPLPLHQREATDIAAPLSTIQSFGTEALSCDSEDLPPLLPHERVERRESSFSLMPTAHPYPTPPISKPPSLKASKVDDSILEDGGAVDANTSSCTSQSSFTHRKTISDSLPPKAGRASVMWKTLSSIVTPSNVHAVHFSNPSEPDPPNKSNTPIHSRIASGSLVDSLSYGMLKKLTIGDKKSHPSTPTRALSNNTSTSDTSAGSDHGNGRRKVADVTGSKASTPEANGAQVKAPRGKLTVKIVEARGLRRNKEPYVVAVFQRNELVSKGPRSEDTEDEDEEAVRSPIGGIPISRQGSDSGRPMAIPMKSRQSSSTSLTDYRDFKMKARKSMTNPKWDTEAVL
jgi:protein-serine/threonine kinase